jgi:hypothetical protein
MSFYKNGEQEGKKVLSEGGWMEDTRKGYWRVNMVEILYTNICKKHETC